MADAGQTVSEINVEYRGTQQSSGTGDDSSIAASFICAGRY